MFVGALERSFPVLRRVGDGYFHRLARSTALRTRRAAATCTGSARNFAAWLATASPPMDVRLAGGPRATRVGLRGSDGRRPVASDRSRRSGRWRPRRCPKSVSAAARPRTVSSAFPVWSVWRADQPDGTGDPVASHRSAARRRDLRRHRTRPSPAARSAVPFVAALSVARSLRSAVDSSALDVQALPRSWPGCSMKGSSLRSEPTQ